MANKTDITDFLQRYLGQDVGATVNITQNDIDNLIMIAEYEKVEQKIIDYGTKYPDAPFWDFMQFLSPGVHGETEEELLSDDE